MFEWCSISVITTSSPASRNVRPHEWATRLIASVVLRVKTISSAAGAPMNVRSFSRTPSCCSVASTERVCTPRWMLALLSR